MTKYPPDSDLRRLLQFAPDTGAIWLGDARMVLVHSAALAALRRDLIASVGPQHARRLLTRLGHASGMRDAELARKARGAREMEEIFLVGPQLHMLEGAARVTPVSMEVDVAAGRFQGTFLWSESWEAIAHRKEYGQVEEPACWTLLGYASGYTSAFMGRHILFKELACTACGDEHCRIEGRPVEDWPDGEAQRQFFENDSLLEKIEALGQQVEALKSTLEPAQAGALVGASPAFKKAENLMRRAATTQVTVLLQGETGVGKERFARAIHELSPRAKGPFVAINCAALPAELIEAELFGVEKGAYTGAHAARAGRFERADGGTLFLDEVGDLPLAAQAKLLRVLQEGEIERLGSESGRKVNVRLVAATNVDLEEAVKASRFRRDLYYRLNVYPICIPPLRERTGDIEPLARQMLARFSALHGKRLTDFGDRALQALRHHDWPGNVRELENLVERGVILAGQGEVVDLHELFPAPPSPDAATLDDQGRLARRRDDQAGSLYDELQRRNLTLEALEDGLIQEAVERAEGNLSAAARALGLTRPQLSYRLQKVQERAQR